MAGTVRRKWTVKLARWPYIMGGWGDGDLMYEQIICMGGGGEGGREWGLQSEKFCTVRRKWCFNISITHQWLAVALDLSNICLIFACTHWRISPHTIF
jgi:hypothetical protein